MDALVWVLESLSTKAIADILVVALLFFGLSFFIRGTQAVALLRSILVVVGVVIIANLMGLDALSWLVRTSLPVLAFTIPVIFQPELRRGLERLGRAGFFLNSRRTESSRREEVINEICEASEKLSERRHGGLIVLQRNSSLEEYIRTGIPLDSEVTSEILLTIFWPKTELHDGAAIINTRGRIASAASVLPLSSSRNLPNRNLGTRHRAALGISEVSDAITIVVSEETGRISITDGGRMIPRLDARRLHTILSAIYSADRARPTTPREWLREQVENLGLERRKQT
ncbi:MAG: diadenylate cyclase CdaA [Anaerolineae bacterium]|nr:diadenylate cyclase CdaA [Anaerolineae bacterium]